MSPGLGGLVNDKQPYRKYRRPLDGYPADYYPIRRAYRTDGHQRPVGVGSLASALVLPVGGTPAPADTHRRPCSLAHTLAHTAGRAVKGTDYSASDKKDKPAQRRARKNLTVKDDGLASVSI